MLQVRAWKNTQKRSEIQIYTHVDFKQQNDHLASHQHVAELLLQLSPAAENSSLSVSFVISWFSDDLTSPVVTEADRISSVPGWDSVCVPALPGMAAWERLAWGQVDMRWKGRSRWSLKTLMCNAQWDSEKRPKDGVYRRDSSSAADYLFVFCLRMNSERQTLHTETEQQERSHHPPKVSEGWSKERAEWWGEAHWHRSALKCVSSISLHTSQPLCECEFVCVCVCVWEWMCVRLFVDAEALLPEQSLEGNRWREIWNLSGGCYRQSVRKDREDKIKSAAAFGKGWVWGVIWDVKIFMCFYHQIHNWLEPAHYC